MKWDVTDALLKHTGRLEQIPKVCLPVTANSTLYKSLIVTIVHATIIEPLTPQLNSVNAFSLLTSINSHNVSAPQRKILPCSSLTLSFKNVNSALTTAFVLNKAVLSVMTNLCEFPS